MENLFMFIVVVSIVIWVLIYLIELPKLNKKIKNLETENEILKHDSPSRIVDTYRIKVSEYNLKATIECGAYPKGMKIIFSTKSDNERLDTYDLTLKELLNILQKHYGN